jgi:hypothetical protein
VQSFKPCHLTGDPDLYGIGIRVGFYLQYLAAIIAIVSKADEDFIGWRVAFVPLAAATFLGLCVNSTRDTLVIMDWAIMLELVLSFPLFFALPVFKGLRMEKELKQELLIQKRLAKEKEVIRENKLEVYADAIKDSFGALINAEDRIMDGSLDSQSGPNARRLVLAVKNAAVEWVHAMEQRPEETTDHAGRFIRERIGAAISQLEDTPDDLQVARTRVRNLQLTPLDVEAC